MKLLYGTGNAGKLRAMRQSVNGLPIELVSFAEVGTPPFVEETGRTPLENAVLKAQAYYKAFHMPVFSCDSGLYIEELPEAEQPGLFVRRRPEGGSMTDSEMTQHYAALAALHGGRVTARYRNAICLILDGTRRFSSMDKSLFTDRFWLCDTPHERREPGFPLDCLSLHIPSGVYHYDRLQKEGLHDSCSKGFYCFFEHVLSEIGATGGDGK